MSFLLLTDGEYYFIMYKIVLLLRQKPVSIGGTANVKKNKYQRKEKMAGYVRARENRGTDSQRRKT